MSNKPAITAPVAFAPAVNEAGDEYTILAVDREFVFAGYARWVHGSHGTFCQLTESVTVRQWGTTAGLGELAVFGPTKDTILDYQGVTMVPLRSILFALPCKTPLLIKRAKPDPQQPIDPASGWPFTAAPVGQIGEPLAVPDTGAAS